MISKREITDQQVNEWCRKRGISMLPPYMFICSGGRPCVRVEPVIARDSKGKIIIACGKCCQKCKVCHKYINGADDGACWYCNDDYLELEHLDIEYSETEIINTDDADISQEEGESEEDSEDNSLNSAPEISAGTQRPATRYLALETPNRIPTADPKSLRRRL